MNKEKTKQSRDEKANVTAPKLTSNKRSGSPDNIHSIESNVEQVQQASNSKEILRVREELEKDIKAISLSDESLNQELELGQEVWQFADAKTPEMLMKVVGKVLDEKTKEVIYKTEYLDKDYVKRLGWTHKYCFNAGKYLRTKSLVYGMTTIKEERLKSKLEGFNLGVSLGEKKGKEDALKIIDKLAKLPHASPATPRFDTASQIYMNWKMSFIKELKEKIGVKG